MGICLLVIFAVALFTGNLGAPTPTDHLKAQVYREQTQYISNLSEQELINAVVTAENRAQNATFFYDLLENDETDVFLISSKEGKQVLRLRCWGAYRAHPAKISGATLFLGNRYEVFRTTIQPEMKDGHSVLLKITGDGRILFSRVLTNGMASFPLELDVRGIQNLRLEISSSDHSDSRNPGILLHSAIFI